MNFVFISPNFPKIYSHFVKSLSERGATVLGIGDEPYEQLNQELKDHLTEYCCVTDLSNLRWMKNTISYLQWKYGHLDFIESNNEWWLFSDSYLREYAGVDTGFWPDEMEKIKYKSKMKEYFEKAGVKTARYIMASTYEKSCEFVKLVGYPIFAKPDCGVGANATYKINNNEELKAFHEHHFYEAYIIEEYIHGYITSFDGICDIDSNVILAFNEIFPTPISEIKEEKNDLYYYANCEMPVSFREMGERVVKSFGISKRCFHIEFFHLLEDRPGLAKKGDIIALECNMRSPGGNTPNLLQIALNGSYYDVYADVITTNTTEVDINKEHYIAISVARRKRFDYLYDLSEIKNKYPRQLIEHGTYPNGISEAMGDEYYFGQFKTIEEAMAFQKYITTKK